MIQLNKKHACPLKTYWQEKQCWEYQCDKVSGDTTCDNTFDDLCEYQKSLKKLKENASRTLT